MFDADIRHRVAPEDILTSRVFGGISLMSPDLVQDCIRVLGSSEPPSASVHVEFWPSFLTRTPDVVLRSESWSLWIEAKAGSPLTPQQLIDEYRDGLPLSQIFELTAVTGDATAPSAVAEANERLRKDGVLVSPIRWTSWMRLHQWLHGIDHTTTDGRLASEVMRYMEHVNLGGFYGFDQANLEAYRHLLTAQDALRNELGDFFTALESAIEGRFERVYPSGGVWRRDGAKSEIRGDLAASWVGRAYTAGDWPHVVWVRFVAPFKAAWIHVYRDIRSDRGKWVEERARALLQDFRRQSAGYMYLQHRYNDAIWERPFPVDELSGDALLMQKLAPHREMWLVLEVTDLTGASAIDRVVAAMDAWVNWERGSPTGFSGAGVHGGHRGAGAHR